MYDEVCIVVPKRSRPMIEVETDDLRLRLRFAAAAFVRLRTGLCADGPAFSLCGGKAAVLALPF